MRIVGRVRAWLERCVGQVTIEYSSPWAETVAVTIAPFIWEPVLRGWKYGNSFTLPLVGKIRMELNK